MCQRDKHTQQTHPMATHQSTQNDGSIGHGLTAADPGVREQAIEELTAAIIGSHSGEDLPKHPASMEALSTLYATVEAGLEHDNRHIRQAALRACQRIRTEAPEAIAPLNPAIRACANDPIPTVRQAAHGCLTTEDTILHVYAAD
jgi:hypothetical protein